jgi:hypothetical protein
MTRDDIIRIAHEAGLHLATDVHWMPIIGLEYAEKFAAIAYAAGAAAEREKVARWQIGSGYSTGHGDTIEDLLVELEWQVRESEREACAKFIEDEYVRQFEEPWRQNLSAAIRARGAHD